MPARVSARIVLLSRARAHERMGGAPAQPSATLPPKDRVIARSMTEGVYLMNRLTRQQIEVERG